MKKTLVIFFVVCLIVAVPVFAHAQSAGGLVPCDGTAQDPCDFNALMELASKIMTFLIVISIPLASIAFAYAGILMLTAAGNESKVEKAKEIFGKVLVGFIFVLTAWLIVTLITKTLLQRGQYRDLINTPQASLEIKYSPISIIVSQV